MLVLIIKASMFNVAVPISARAVQSASIRTFNITERIGGEIGSGVAKVGPGRAQALPTVPGALPT